MNLIKTNKISSLIVLLGVLLSFFQLVYNRSLWVDEAMLALNIQGKSHLELLQPLDLNQVAPILFLQLEKFFSTLIANEIGLRIFPFLCFITSTYLFSKILKIEIGNTISIIGISLFAFNHNLIYFSSEVKQYICDVLLISSIFFILIDSFKNENLKFIALGLVGSFGIFLSNVSPIILLTAGIYLITNKKYHFNYLKKIFLLFLFWTITFAFYFFKFIYNHPSRAGMLDYWQTQNAFLPKNLFSYEALYFIASKIYGIIKLISPIDNFVCYGIISILLFTGFLKLIKSKNIKLLILIFCPILIHLILSYFKLYPFESRLILYFIPGLTILITFGLFFLTKKITHKSTIYFSIYMSLSALILIMIQLPIKREEIKENLVILKKERKENEDLYIYYGAKNAFTYYENISFYNSKNVIFGNPYWENQDLYINEILDLKKGKLWILFSHDYENEQNHILTNLESKGLKILKRFESKGSCLYLFE